MPNEKSYRIAEGDRDDYCVNRLLVDILERYPEGDLVKCAMCFEGLDTECPNYVPVKNIGSDELQQFIEIEGIDRIGLNIGLSDFVKNRVTGNYNSHTDSEVIPKDVVESNRLSDSDIYDAIDDGEMSPEEVTSYSNRRALDSDASQKGRPSRRSKKKWRTE